MPTTPHRIPSESPLSARRQAGRLREIALAAVVWAAALIGLERAGLAEFLEHRVVRALEFKVRAALGRATPLDPRIKIYGIDDTTASFLGRPRPTDADWALLLGAFAAARPRAVIIDGLFSVDADAGPEQRAALAALGASGVPLIAGTMLSPFEIGYRERIPTARLDGVWGARAAAPHVKAMPNTIVYGPAPAYLEAFRRVGHIMQPWPARMAPAIAAGGGVVVPHVGLLAAERLALTERGVEVDGRLVPTDAEGLAVIDFLEPRTVAGAVKRLMAPIQRARTGVPLESVGPDDVVVVVANFSTGNTDFLDSPFGQIPGGYILVSNVNSVLRGKWIARLGDERALIGAFAAAGAALGALSPGLMFFALLGGAGVAYLAAALAAFAFAQTSVPWLFPLAALTAAGLTTYAQQRYRESRRRMHLEMEIATASALQRHFFPPPAATHPAFELAAFYHPADAVGGDWYSYYVYGGRWLHVHLGDVTGHGTSAALLASFAKGATDMIYEDHAKRGEPNVPLAKLHASLNTLLRPEGRVGEDMVFMTLWSMAIDLETGECLCMNSGHRPALRADESGAAAIRIRSDSSILGYTDLPPNLEVGRVQLRGDETLLILSDGLMDVPTSFGIKTQERHLKRLLARLRGMPPEALRDAMLRELGMERRQGLEFMDDVTFVVLQLKGLQGAAVRRGA